MKKLKKNQIKQTKPQISLDKFYLSLKISNEKALTATRLLNRHNLSHQLAFSLRQGLLFNSIS